MKSLNHIELDSVFGGTGDEEDWVDIAAKTVRNLARGTRGFFNGLFGFHDCHCQ